MLNWTSKLGPGEYRLCRVIKVFPDANGLVGDAEVKLRPRRKTEPVLPYKSKKPTTMVVSIQRLKLVVPMDYIAEAPEVNPSLITPNLVESHWPQLPEKWKDVYLNGVDCVCGSVHGVVEAGTIFSMNLEANPNPFGHLSMMPRISTSSLITQATDLAKGPCLNDPSAEPEDVPGVPACAEAGSDAPTISISCSQIKICSCLTCSFNPIPQQDVHILMSDIPYQLNEPAEAPINLEAAYYMHK